MKRKPLKRAVRASFGAHFANSLSAGGSACENGGRYLSADGRRKVSSSAEGRPRPASRRSARKAGDAGVASVTRERASSGVRLSVGTRWWVMLG